jgi:HprK-related kinase A
MRGSGLPLKIGPFWVKLRSSIPDLVRHVSMFYGECETDNSIRFFDFHVTLKKCGILRRWVKPQVTFLLDEYSPFKPLPYAHAFAMFEWGLNWCIATTAHHYLIIHAAVLEKEGRAIVMPGVPGSGKSTLCAAMSLKGWRLLSDEMALVDPLTLDITPVPRPVGLKNESIGVITAFSSEAVTGAAARDTAKGTVVHLRPTVHSMQQADIKSRPHAIVFPKYLRGSDTRLQVRARVPALLEIQENAFNTHVLGKGGFESVRSIVEQFPVYTLEYSDLDQALPVMDAIHAGEEVVGRNV